MAQTLIQKAQLDATLYSQGGTDVAVADGGTGRSVSTAFAPLFGGTTTTAAHQSATAGLVGQILSSGGAAAIGSYADRGIVIASSAVGTGATFDILNIPSTYCTLFLYFDSVSCDTATREFQIRWSANNGTSFSSVTTDYRGHTFSSPVAGGAGSTISGKSRATLTETATQAAAAVRVGSLQITGNGKINNPQYASYANDGTTQWFNFGQMVSSGAINALRLQWDASGNFDSGSFVLVGF